MKNQFRYLKALLGGTILALAAVGAPAQVKPKVLDAGIENPASAAVRRTNSGVCA